MTENAAPFCDECGQWCDNPRGLRSASVPRTGISCFTRSTRPTFAPLQGLPWGDVEQPLHVRLDLHSCPTPDCGANPGGRRPDGRFARSTAKARSASPSVGSPVRSASRPSSWPRSRAGLAVAPSSEASAEPPAFAARRWRPRSEACPLSLRPRRGGARPGPRRVSPAIASLDVGIVDVVVQAAALLAGERAGHDELGDVSDVAELQHVAVHQVVPVVLLDSPAGAARPGARPAGGACRSGRCRRSST